MSCVRYACPDPTLSTSPLRPTVTFALATFDLTATTHYTFIVV